MYYFGCFCFASNCEEFLLDLLIKSFVCFFFLIFPLFLGLCGSGLVYLFALFLGENRFERIANYFFLLNTVPLTLVTHVAIVFCLTVFNYDVEI